LQDSAVVLADIRKSYRIGFKRKRKTAVDGLSLDVRPGQIFGLLGPNGAGKTTTLKVLLGLVRPDSGGGELLGSPLGDRAAHSGLGFLPEQPYFYLFLNAGKGLELYGRFFGLSGRELDSRAAELLDMVGLGRDAHLTLDKFSKGMLQRFGIAQALINDPELVILDEPASGLDPVGQKEIRDILLGLKERGKTIFLSSHQLSEVEDICDSVSIINRGRTAREGRLADLLAVEGLTRITARGAGSEERVELSSVSRAVSVADGYTVMDVESDAVFPALDKVRSAGLELVSVSPLRRSLEDLFMEVIKENPN